MLNIKKTSVAFAVFVLQFLHAKDSTAEMAVPVSLGPKCATVSEIVQMELTKVDFVASEIMLI